MRLRMQKRKGSGELITGVVTITTMIIFLIFSVYIFSNLSRKSELDQIARRYMLVMETEGFLSPSEQANLIDDLSALNYIEKVTIEPTTTTSEAPYGTEITLEFSCELKLNTIEFLSNSLFSASYKAQDGVYHVSLKSTSKN